MTELLVASALVLLVVAAVGSLALPVNEAASSQPEAIDLQQRARVMLRSLFRDVYAAGAGLDRGVRSGPLTRSFAAIVPRRIGAQGADPPATARSDVVSVIWTPATDTQATIVAPFSTTPATVRNEPGCPPLLPACAARPNMGVVVFDRSGAFSLFTVDSVSGPNAVLRPRGAPSAHPYGDDAAFAEVEARTYYLDAAARQLRQYDTDQTDVPVMDDVIGLSIEYFGSSDPAALPKPAAGNANCLYDAGGSLLPGGQVLPIADDGLAGLPLALFVDGPWCGVADMQYDADLMRVRRVRVTARLQATSAALRGSDSRFGVGGTLRGATRAVPDVVVSIDITPRNINLPR